MSPSHPSYSQEDVQQILNRAIARQVKHEEFSREQLLEIAEELSIPTTTLALAEKEWQETKSLQLHRQDFDAIRKSDLQQSLVRYGITNSFLVGINLLMKLSFGFSFPWAGFILLIWGVFLALRFREIYWDRGEAYEEAFQSWYRRYQARSFLNRWLGRLGRLLSV
jgi:hypothetical protein